MEAELNTILRGVLFVVGFAAAIMKYIVICGNFGCKG